MRWWLLACISQAAFAAAGYKAYESALYLLKEEGNLFGFILYSVDFAPFITLAGTASVLGIMRYDKAMDMAIMFRTGDKKKYFRYKWLCCAVIVSAWTLVTMLIRIATGMLAGYGTEVHEGKADAATILQFMMFMAAYLIMVVWLREIAGDFVANPVLQNMIPLLFSVTELAVYKSLNHTLLAFLPLGNVLTEGIAYSRNLWGRSAYWAFILYGSYYVKTEITCKREIEDI